MRENAKVLARRLLLAACAAVALTALAPAQRAGAVESFRLTDEEGRVVACFDQWGDLYLAGGLTSKTASIVPSAAKTEWIGRRNDDQTVVIVFDVDEPATGDLQGNLTTSGTIQFRESIDLASIDELFVVRNHLGEAASAIDAEGNILLTGRFFENMSMREMHDAGATARLTASTAAEAVRLAWVWERIGTGNEMPWGVHIYRSETENDGYQIITTVPPDRTSYLDESVQVGTIYHYYVVFTRGGTSGFSVLGTSNIASAKAGTTCDQPWPEDWF